jgi:hypothetical protein
MDLWLALFWTGPIGIGVFVAGLGVLFWGIAQLRKYSPVGLSASLLHQPLGADWNSSGRFIERVLK